MTHEAVLNRNNGNLQYEDEYKIIKGFIDNQQLIESFNYLSNLQKQLGTSITAHDKLVLDVLLCIVQTEANKTQETLELISSLEGTIQDQLMFIDFTIAKATTFWKSGKQPEALKSLNDIKGIFSDYKAKISSNGQIVPSDVFERESDIQNIKGISSWLLGDFQTALEAFQQSLTLRKELPNKEKLAKTLNNLGVFYTYQGELQTALDQYNTVIEILKDLPNKEALALAYGNIGEVYQYMGHFGFALDFYTLALDILETKDDKLRKANIYSLIISLQVESNNLPEAQIYLDKLKPLDVPVGNNSFIHTLFLISEGLILKNSESLMKKFKSGENFLEIANAPVVNTDLTAKAIFNLNDILLLEAKLSKNEKRISEVQSWLNKLISIAEEQKSSVLLIQCYLLDSKLKLLGFKVNEAKKILSKAQNLANEKGLNKFVYIIALELNQLLSQEQQWVELRVRGGSIDERIDLAGLEQTLDNLINKRQNKSELVELIKKSIAPSMQNSPLKNEQIMENFYKYISNETYITIYRMSELGPVIYLTDELKFSQTEQELLEIKLGVYFTTAVGQGDNSNVGMFGPLPFPDSSDYLSMIYACFMYDPENNDPRAKKHSYSMIIITFPKDFEPYYDNKNYLSQIFDNFQKKFEKIQDITRKDLEELKVDLVK